MTAQHIFPIPALHVTFLHYGVGQGLFTAGVLKAGGQTLSWVHDCGSNTKGGSTLIARGCTDLDTRIGPSHGRPRLDLLAISHFDKDHINGVVQLLGRYDVGTIMLPYYAPWKRLVAAFSSSTDVDLARFSLDPIAYLNAVPGARIERFVLVEPGSGQDRDIPLPDGKIATVPDGDGLSGPLRSLTDADTAERPDLVDSHAGSVVQFLPAGKSLVFSDLWEFLPYADPKHGPARRRNFEALVDAHLARLRRSSSIAARDAALDALRAFFDLTFGGGPKARNRISLCLFSGPLDSPAHTIGTVELIDHKTKTTKVLGTLDPRQRRVAQLLTGDAALKADAPFKRFLKHFNLKTRLRRILVFQVMHHGASANSHIDAPRRIDPRWSIFSSDPHRKKPHPHKDVWNLYKGHGRVQVDEDHSFRIVMKLIPGSTWVARQIRPRRP